MVLISKRRPRLSGSNEPDDYDDDSIMRSERSTPLPTVKRPRPKRAAYVLCLIADNINYLTFKNYSAISTSQEDPEVIVISSDSDEGDPPPKRALKTR